jgi:hypothetical protein
MGTMNNASIMEFSSTLVAGATQNMNKDTAGTPAREECCELSRMPRSPPPPEGSAPDNDVRSGDSIRQRWTPVF